MWEILLIVFFVASPYYKKGSVFEEFFVIAIMSLMACCKFSSMVVFGKASAFGIYWSVSVILLCQLREYSTAYTCSGKDTEQYYQPGVP